MTRPKPRPRLPMTLCQVLEEEHRALYPECSGIPVHACPGRDPCPWRITPEQIPSPGRLVLALCRPERQTAAAVAAGIASIAELREAVDQFEFQTFHTLHASRDSWSDEHLCQLQCAIGGQALDRIYSDLNTLICRCEPPYSYRAADVALGEWTLQMASYDWTDEDDNHHRNRLLVEQVFPGLIEPIYAHRLRALRRCIHEDSPAPAALCLSGGGIRSASFALGVMQGLAKRGLLGQFHYLSTVSGGGYIGGWLTAWIHRRGGNVQEVVKQLTHPPTAPGEAEFPDPIRYLRMYSNYLSPRGGAFSSDTWTLAAVTLRNMLLNWLVLLPLMLAVLALPRLVVSANQLGVTGTLNGNLRVPANLLQLANFVLALVAGVFGGVSVALSRARVRRAASPPLSPHSVRARPPGPWTRRWRGAWAAVVRNTTGRQGFFWLCFVPLFVSTLAFAVAQAWWQFAAWDGARQQARQGTALSFSAVFLVAAAVTGMVWIVYLVVAEQPWSVLRRIGRPRPRRAGLLVLLILVLVLLILLVVRPDGIRLIVGAAVVAAIGVLYRGGMKLVFGGIALLVGALSAAVLLVALTSSTQLHAPTHPLAYTTFFVPAVLGILALVIFLSVGASSYVIDDSAREWTSRATAYLLLGAVGWITLCGLTLYGPRIFADPTSLRSAAVAAAGGASGVITFISARIGLGSDKDTGKAEATSPTTGKDLVRLLGLNGVALVFLLVLAAALSLGTSYVIFHIRPALDLPRDAFLYHPIASITLPLGALESGELQFDHTWVVEHTNVRYLAGFVAALTAISVVASIFIYVNTFSLHATYRDRLIRAFLGASNRVRHPNAFSELDDNDNLYLKDIWPQRQDQKYERRNPPRLLHVVNMALNIVSGRRLDWQERKAEPFTMTPLHAGNFQVGYRRIKDGDIIYGGRRTDGVSLGTAMAISGAAASPNMGYHSSPLVTFAMTLLNARLGAWLGNPGIAGRHTFAKHGLNPLAFPPMIVREALGMTNDISPYVYLSDGGHFDNLGLYEMALRRCRLIVVSDATSDPECAFNDVANAIRKIRIDMGISIVFTDASEVYSRTSLDVGSGKKKTSEEKSTDERKGDGSDAAAKKERGKYVRIARIRYSDADGTARGEDGWLIVFKPAYYGREPADVRVYAERNTSFPNESTGDQMFTESQLESYRMLGEFAVIYTLEQAEEMGNAGTNVQALAELIRVLRPYLERPPSPRTPVANGHHNGNGKAIGAFARIVGVSRGNSRNV